MKQKRFAFADGRDLRWEDLPPEARRKVLELLAELIGKAWRRKEAADER